jgi:glycosyltransferase involved in cell wall biosynthesis
MLVARNRVPVAIDATPLQTGHRYRGIGSYAAGLIDALSRVPHPEPLGLMVQPRQSSDLPILCEVVARRGVQIIPLHKPRWKRDRLQWLIDLPVMKVALHHYRPRIYHALEFNGLVLARGVTILATLHDLIPLHDPAAHFPMRWMDQRIGYARYLHALQRVDCILANSEFTRQEAVERLHIPPERIVVIPLAVDEGRFYPRSQDEIDNIVARYGLRRPYFLHISSNVGPSDNNKNTKNILRAFDLFCRDGGAEHNLTIVGKWSPHAIAEVRASYANLLDGERLRMLGFVPHDDLPALYSGADALIYPSLLEGFGLPVLEAMRCGTPVLTSSTSSLPEVAGAAALFVDPSSVEEIASGMQQLVRDSALRAELVRRGLQQAAQFTFNRTAEETLRVYHAYL